MAQDDVNDPKHPLSAYNLPAPQDDPNATIIKSASSQERPAVLAQASTPASDDVAKRRLAPGTTLSNGRYKIEKLIAVTSTSAVYRALEQRLNRPCAVKELLDNLQDEAERARSVAWFTREAMTLSRLDHPNISHIHDFFMEEGRAYLVMDFIEGHTLSEVLEQEGNVPGVNGARGVSEVRARNWAGQLCNVLSYLHRQTPPLLFGNLNPSNIMLTARDEIKLVGFGLGRRFQQQASPTQILTIGYTPPEQLTVEPEPRSDLYALGATLHRVLTHHDPADNKPGIFDFPPVRSLRPDISSNLEQAITKALMSKPTDRWTSAADMERAILHQSSLPASSAGPAWGAQNPARQAQGSSGAQPPDSWAQQQQGWGAQNPAQPQQGWGAQPPAQQQQGWGAQQQDPIASTQPDTSGGSAPTGQAWGQSAPARSTPPDAPGGLPPAMQYSPDITMVSPIEMDVSSSKKQYSPDITLATPNANLASKNLAAEDVQFTAFHSRVLPTDTWQTLLVYAYVETALQAIHDDVARFKDELGTLPAEVNVWAAQPLSRGIEMTVIPSVPGVKFNPEQIVFTWVEDWHSAKFRLWAGQRLAGTVGNGEIAIYVGPLLIATLKLSLRFVKQGLFSPISKREDRVQVSASPYRKIFTSYNHADTPVVLALRTAYKALGDESFIDIEHLRSGQNWNASLMRLIDAADIFQLFWSGRAARSPYVTQEWQYALQHSKGESFIRPVYWENPMPQPPAALSHLHFQYIEMPNIYDDKEDNAGSPAAPAEHVLQQVQDRLSGGRIEQAFALLAQAYQMEPDNALVHKLYGQVFARRTPPNPEMAMQAYNRALQLDAQDPETHRLIGDALLYLQHLPAQAILPYTQALRLKPHYVEAHYGLARSYEETGQILIALQEYQKIAELDSSQSGIYYTVGRLALRLNQLPTAERACVQLLHINPADLTTRFILAQIYERTGRLEDAWRECNSVVKTAPTHEAAQAMLQRLRATRGR